MKHDCCMLVTLLMEYYFSLITFTRLAQEAYVVLVMSASTCCQIT